MAKEKAKVESMKLLLTAEFPMDGNSFALVDILCGIQNAIEELQGYGEVKSAKLIVPKNEMELV
jgi:hypothetical protein